ncbi:amino acid adenylation domain-containing protein [Longibaculum muris]|uniref:amino acid adenylation domain-containing protein n=1 Tax=Longibaculum muris TaxID=1796628 RepID=UPI0022E48689|nr:amino acid adenylation domain-containing protein [Longibaculum muris]
MKNILEYLEKSAQQYFTKVAFTDENHEMTYGSCVECSKKIGTALLELKAKRKPIAVLMDKNVESLTGFFGVVYSGNFYVVIDCYMPKDRIEKIFETLKPIALITDYAHQELALSLHHKVYLYEDLMTTKINQVALDQVRNQMIDTDPLYALFTSGSTGVPKGAVVSHRNVINYASWYKDTFDINEETQFGSQTPFYFSMSVSDVFSTIISGATLHILPKKLFSFPIKLIEYMNEKKVNTIYWVPSALCIIANLKVLDYLALEYVNKVLFAGEVMPTKQLNYWIKKIPDAMYANLFGPTETTDICTYYIIDREFKDDEVLPIGKACNNCDVFLLDENNQEVTDHSEGELCVRGSFLALGYYNNEEKTKEAFMQNPLNQAYPEIIYRTGDLVKYNEFDELIYITRKDFQIKHMGYRIELGEIEAAVNALEKIQACAVIFDEGKDKIVLIYTGKMNDQEIMEEIKNKVPSYMYPNVIIKKKIMPYNQNGKIDRKWLKNHYED